MLTDRHKPAKRPLSRIATLLLAVAVWLGLAAPLAAQIIGQPIPLISDRQVNRYTANDQRPTHLVRLADGGYVVVWDSFGEDGPDWGVFVQRYRADHTRFGPPRRVNTYTASDQFVSSVIALKDGGYIVIWTSLGQIISPTTAAVYAQRFRADNTKFGSERLVHRYADVQPARVFSVALEDGGYVISWAGRDASGTGRTVFAKRFDVDNRPLSAEERVNTTSTSYLYPIDLTVLRDGGYLITWSSGTTGAVSLRAQRFAATGERVGGELQVADPQFSLNPVLVRATKDSGFAFTWGTSFGPITGPVSGYGIYLRRYRANNTAIIEPIRVDTAASDNQDPAALIELNDGSLVAVWNAEIRSASTKWDVFSQRFTRAGNRVGQPMQVNTYSQGEQRANGAAALDDGGYVIAWSTGWHNNPERGYAYTRRFAPNNSPLEEEMRLSDDPALDGGVHGVYQMPYGGYLAVFGNALQRIAVNNTRSGRTVRLSSGIGQERVVLGTAQVAYGDLVAVWRWRNVDNPGGNDTGVYLRPFRIHSEPIARNDTASVGAGSTTILNPLRNDRDPDPYDRLLIREAQVDHGSVEIINGGRHLRYTAPASGCTSARITYKIGDWPEHRASAVVTVTITP